MNALIEQWIRPEIRSLSAYHVPAPGDLIKLDAMENPYTWEPDLIEAWLETLRGVSVNRYPDPSSSQLKARLREAMAVPPGADILLGNGSDEIIQMIAMALAQPGRVVMAPEPSFVMYRMIATFVGMDYVGVPLNADFALDLDAMLTAIAEHRPAVIFLAYPNNPTGNLFPAEHIEAILNAADGLVVVDEAYAPFTDASFMSRLGTADGEFPNLVVMRTVSKMGLAGLRLGLLAGDPAWLNEFDKLRLPYNINVLTQVSADFALANADVFDRQTRAIRHERERMLSALRAMDGLTVFPSDANFILLRTPPDRATAVFMALKAAGLLIKNLSGVGGPLTDCLRVTVGRPEENDAFLAGLRGAL
ncbi:MAG: histidinol-phosphate transaminase [Gammaproteobacteria bacterium]|nr:histidinol-phosphate transaminase [Gammaproteobacteria bacterium]MCP5136112.1 histidinol-phosphate transaminase [Gammaproteobacteria bacterium]